jgi:hypothetical protein
MDDRSNHREGRLALLAAASAEELTDAAAACSPELAREIAAR